MCQAENERFGRNSLSKSETVSNRTDLKTNFLKNLSNGSNLSNREILSSRRTKISKHLSKPETLSTHKNSQIKSFVKNRLCFKWRQILPPTSIYTKLYSTFCLSFPFAITNYCFIRFNVLKVSGYVYKSKRFLSFFYSSMVKTVGKWYSLRGRGILISNSLRFNTVR